MKLIRIKKKDAKKSDSIAFDKCNQAWEGAFKDFQSLAHNIKIIKSNVKGLEDYEAQDIFDNLNQLKGDLRNISDKRIKECMDLLSKKFE